MEDSSPTPKHHDRLRELKSVVDEELEQSRAVERAISCLLETDADLRGMYLSHPPPDGHSLNGHSTAHSPNIEAPRHVRRQQLPPPPPPTPRGGGEQPFRGGEQPPVTRGTSSLWGGGDCMSPQSAHETLEILLESYLQVTTWNGS